MASKAPLRESDPVEISTYRLLGRLGEGGMGVVYLAETQDGHLVAVKVIREHLAEDTDFRARFRSEVANASKVPRFCTAPILDADTEANPPYIVTEYIDGPTLTAVVTEHGRLPGSQLHALGVGIASALGAIHHAGVIHRDLKPGNVLLSRFGPQVIDFGIARAVDAVTHLTQPGRVMGSPSFMAPEQLRGQSVSPKADIFAWGAVMAYAGTGNEPFGATTDAVYYQVLYGQPDLTGLDPNLAAIVAATLHKDPDQRPTAAELLDKLVRSTGEPARQDAQWQVPGGARHRATDDAAHPPADAHTAIVPPQPPPAADGQAPPTGRRAERQSREQNRKAHRTAGNRRRAIWIAAGVAGILFGGALAYGATSYLDFRDGRSTAIAAVNGYLTDLKAGQYDVAYNRLCGAAQRDINREDFIARSQAGARVVSFEVHAGSVPFTLGDVYQVNVTVRRTDGQPDPQRFVVRPPESGRQTPVVCPR